MGLSRFGAFGHLVAGRISSAGRGRCKRSTVSAKSMLPWNPTLPVVHVVSVVVMIAMIAVGVVVVVWKLLGSLFWWRW